MIYSQDIIYFMDVTIFGAALVLLGFMLGVYTSIKIVKYLQEKEVRE